jgi:hypothetical protein
VAEAKPNAAHLALAEMERLFPEFHLITQNVDGLHQRAGSRNVIELHGNITRTKCFEEGTVVTGWKETGDVSPRCPNCGGMLRQIARCFFRLGRPRWYLCGGRGGGEGDEGVVGEDTGTTGVTREGGVRFKGRTMSA